MELAKTDREKLYDGDVRFDGLNDLYLSYFRDTAVANMETHPELASTLSSSSNEVLGRALERVEIR